MSSSADLHIVVLNYRTPALTVSCMASLDRERQSVPGLRVSLVDNASGDDSVEVIGRMIAEKGWESWVRFMPLHTNLGFAGGNNAALREILAAEEHPPFVLLLNSDTLVHQGCLAACLAAMEAAPDVGALSCLLRNGDGSVQNEARLFPSPGRETIRAFGLPWILPKLFAWADIDDPSWERDRVARDVEWIGGAFMLLRYEVLACAGLLCEDFFFYGEDIEFCHRIGHAGWRIVHDPCGTITHYGGASSGESHIRNRLRDALVWKARFRVQRLCWGPAAALWIRTVYIAVFGLRMVWLFASGKAQSEKFRSISSGFLLLCGNLDAVRS